MDPHPVGARAEGLFALATLAFPRALRVEVGEEMRRTFGLALANRRRLGGRGAALSYAVRATVDVFRVGARERWNGWKVRYVAPSSARRGDGSMREFWVDVRQGARRLRRTPGFALAAVLMLALGIGANTAVFSALKAVLLAPLPYPSPERLVWLELELGPSASEAMALPWSYPKFGVLAAGSERALESVAGYGLRVVTLSGRGDPQRLTVELVAGRYFETLGVTPSLGRSFDAEELDNAEGPPAVILSQALWRSAFGADPGVVGGTVQVNDRAVQVVGIGPAGFAGVTGNADAWLPAPTAGQIISPVIVRSRHAHWASGIGRLADGETAESAAQRLGGVARSVSETYPMEGLGDYAALRVTPLSEARVNGQSRAAVGVLMAAAAMVLLIACANLAGLLLARGRSQSRAAAIRLALGAGRARVARSALAESLVLAAVGGGLGLLMARWGIQALRSAWPARFLTPEGATIRSVDLGLLRLDAGAIGFAVLATLLTVLIFGLVPALRTAGVAPQETLRAGGTITRGRAGRRWPAAAILVAAQMALALVLLVGAGLMFDSLLRLRSVPVGFDTSEMLVMDVTVSRNSPAFERPVPLREALVARIASLPGVDAATLGCAPLYGLCWTGGVTGLDGRAVESDATVGIHMVPDGFFETLRIPVIAGRTFGPSDRDGGPPVVVINQRAAQRIFGEENPIGRTMKVTADITEEQHAEVIGIVGDVLQGRPDQGPQPEAYFTERQMAEAGGALMIRTRGEPLDAVSAVRAAARDVDPTIVVDRARTMNDMRARALGDTRVLLVLLGLFAFVAVALAGAGLWAIVALSVADRRRELGLRVVLGARSSELIAMVTRQGFGAALAGAAVGGWAAWGLSRLLSSLLFETNAHEPVAFVGAAIVLLAGALLASVIPARRATRVDPARTLRAD